MSKTFWNPKLSLIFSRQVHTNPLTKCRGLTTNIDSNIKYFANDTTYQFTLSIRGKLIVQSTKYALAGPRMIVLNKFNAVTNSLFKFLLIKAFKKEPTFITKYLGFYNFYIGNFCIDYVHFSLESKFGDYETGIMNRKWRLSVTNTILY